MYVFHLPSAPATHKVTCADETMRVDVALPSENFSSEAVYLDGMKGYPDPKCKPTIRENLAVFELSLTNIYDCGVTRVINQITVRTRRVCVPVIECNGRVGVLQMLINTTTFA